MFLNVDRRNTRKHLVSLPWEFTAKRERRGRYTKVTFVGDGQVPRLFARNLDLYSYFYMCKHATSEVLLCTNVLVLFF